MFLAKSRSRYVIACAGVFIWTQLVVSTLAQDPPGKDSSTTPTESSEPQAIAPIEIIPPQLLKRATVKFEDVTLLDLAKWLETETGLSVLIDEDELKFEKLSLNDPYSDRLLGQPIHLLLNRLNHGLGWFVEENVIHITALEASDPMTLKLYSVGDLLRDGYTRDSLLNVVKDQTSGPWIDIDLDGGDASLFGDTLIVRQTHSIQNEIAHLLIVFRNHGTEGLIFETPEEARIRKVLNEKLSVDFQGVPLSEAMEAIGKQMKLDIRIDIIELSNVGVDHQTPVSLTRKDESLELIIEALLDDLGLGYSIYDGVLWVTYPIGCSSLSSYIHNVSDLCSDEFDAQLLSKMIIENTAGPWYELDRDGGDITFPKPGMMIVRQAPYEHDTIRGFLQNYREVLQKPPTSRHSHYGDEVLTRYYKLETSLAEKLSEVLWDIVPNSMQKIDDKNTVPQVGKIVVIPANSFQESTMIITHRRRVHHQIRKVIDRIKAGDPPLDSDKKTSQENESGHGFGGGQPKGFF